MRFFKKLLICFLTLALIAAGGAYYAANYYVSPGPLTQESTVIFKKGEGFQAIVDDMGKSGVIHNPLLFKGIAVAIGKARQFKAGEYHFSAAISPRLIIDMIAEGKVVVHKITVPEGLTVQEIKALLTKEAALDGDVPANIDEGSLLPETYHYVYGDTRADMINRMQTAMAAEVSALWVKHEGDLPYTTPEQAVIMASIVEKETGVDSERGRVASVFVNRLRKGMKLQTDPTVAYGIDKSGHLDHALTLDNLRTPTPYNTYVINGLPPTPICNPGRAALEAAMNPPDTNDLYFVATGSGGHNFAATLTQHNDNVKTYHQALKKKLANN